MNQITNDGNHETVPNSRQLLPHAVGGTAMVASAHPRAALIGFETMRRGGSVADAALAMAFAEWVLLPGMCGVGGDALALVRTADGNTKALLGVGAAPAALDPNAFASSGHLPSHGVLSATVPAAVDACWRLHQNYGRLAWIDLLQPAIDLARVGFPLTERVSWNIAKGAELLLQYGDGRPFLVDGQPLGAGGLLVQHDLAATLERIGHDPRDFYEGKIAEAIVECFQAGGSPMDGGDLAQHQAEWAEPLRARYRGWDIIQMPPPSPGLTQLQELLLLSGWEIGDLGAMDAQVIHLMVEAKKVAYRDRLDFLGDPRWVDVPVEHLLSRGYIAQRRRAIDLERAAEDLPTAAAGTSYLAAADVAGNAVAFIHSLSRPEFGCGVIVPDTGIVLNSRAGRSFTVGSGGPNSLAGGKRPASTLNAFMVERNGRLHLTGGTPGGDQQAQWNFQAVVNWVDFRLNPQQTVEAVRWHSSPGTDPRTAGVQDHMLWIEEGLPAATIAGLEKRGHRLRSLGRWARQGAMQLIEIDEEHGVLRGATDPRAGGVAIGF